MDEEKDLNKEINLSLKNESNEEFNLKKEIFINKSSENFYDETFNNELTYNPESSKDSQVIACILALVLFPLFGIIFICSYKIFNKKVRAILIPIFSFFAILSL